MTTINHTSAKENNMNIHESANYTTIEEILKGILTLD